MYRSFRDLREGWTKNLALLFAHPTRLALASIAGVRGCSGRAVVVFNLGSGRSSLRSKQRFQRFSPSRVLWLFCGLHRARALSRTSNIWRLQASPKCLPTLAACVRKVLHGIGKVSWKGRTYAGLGSPVTKDPAAWNRAEKLR